jgi:hypothetical protein
MKNAKATIKGWVNPKTGELLKAQKMTQEQADVLNGVVAPEPKPIAEPAPRDGFPEMQVEVESEVVEEPVEVTPKRRGFGKLFGKK